MDENMISPRQNSEQKNGKEAKEIEACAAIRRVHTERVDLQCWHLKQERWKTTPSVESWSIGYTVFVHTLHFCCVPLNIVDPLFLSGSCGDGELKI
uniref:Uncharacterized protein n=1 Tax=Leersia perrieri TaxID=77586 RepID=A0A0D9VSA8_9ORYZ